MQTIQLEAESRTKVGRRAKDVREQHKIPAVIYGSGVPSRTLSIPVNAFRSVYAEAGRSSLVDVKVDGNESVKAVIKDVQLHPLTLEPIHVDLHQVKMTEKMRAEIPLTFTGEAEAVKALNGTLMTPVESVEVECLPADLPHEIFVDISKLATFEDSITVNDLNVGSGVDVLNNPENVVAFVERPLSEEELKRMEESQLGDVESVAVEGEEEAKAGEEGAKEAEGEEAPKPEEKNEGNKS